MDRRTCPFIVGMQRLGRTGRVGDGVQQDRRRCTGATVLAITDQNRASINLLQPRKSLGGGAWSYGSTHRPTAQYHPAGWIVPEFQSLIPCQFVVRLLNLVPKCRPTAKTGLIMIGPLTLVLDDKSQPHFAKPIERAERELAGASHIGSYTLGFASPCTRDPKSGIGWMFLHFPVPPSQSSPCTSRDRAPLPTPSRSPGPALLDGTIRSSSVPILFAGEPLP